ncbi:MAG: hypothetical protein WCI55_10325 [Armatimonadota bacterium]
MMTSNNNQHSTSLRPSEGRSVVPDTTTNLIHEVKLGQKALDVLYEIGFEEGDDLTDVLLVDIVSVPGGGPKVAKEILQFRESKLTREFSLKFTQDEHWTILHQLISISRVRTQNVITRMNPQTVIEFVNLSSEFILSTRCCGRETYDEVFGLQCDMRKILLKNPNVSYEQLMEAIAS